MNLRDTPKINSRAKKRRIWKRKKKLKRVIRVRKGRKIERTTKKK